MTEKVVRAKGRTQVFFPLNDKLMKLWRIRDSKPDKERIKGGIKRTELKNLRSKPSFKKIP